MQVGEAGVRIAHRPPDRHAGRIVKARGGAHTVRTAQHSRGAGQRRHDSSGGDLADRVVTRVADQLARARQLGGLVIPRSFVLLGRVLAMLAGLLATYRPEIQIHALIARHLATAIA